MDNLLTSSASFLKAVAVIIYLNESKITDIFIHLY